MLVDDKYYPISLLGYPRSGSNWLSYCIEQLSGILTVGTYMDTKEKINSKKCLIAKAHGHDYISCNNTILPFPIMKTFNKEKDGLILLIRNYKECITRHIEVGSKIGATDYLDFDACKKQLYGKVTKKEKQSPNYINNIIFFEGCKNKILIYYEDLIENFEYEINKILIFLHKWGGKKDTVDLDAFISNFEYHLNKSLSFYAPGSATKGDKMKIIYHSNKLNTKIKQQIDSYLEETFPEIFNQYLSRYKEVEKPQIKIVDNLFQHGTSLGSGDLKIYPTYFDYYRGEGKTNNKDVYGDIVLITESSFHLVDSLPQKIKIGWIIEPPQISPKVYQDIKNPEFYNKFTYIMTHIQELLEIDDKFVFYPFAGCWIYSKDWKVYKKSKGISIIASDKRQTDGHKYRHEIVGQFKNKINGIYGRGYKPINYKLEGLMDFRYQIVVENEKRDFWFTEKLIDCFATGVIPVYFGCPSIGRFFNKDGILAFETLGELGHIIKRIATVKNYKKSIVAIKDNLERARQYAITEDWIYNNILKKRLKTR